MKCIKAPPIQVATGALYILRRVADQFFPKPRGLIRLHRRAAETLDEQTARALLTGCVEITRMLVGLRKSLGV